MTDRVLRIGTRGSPLALWQARAVASRLAAVGIQSVIVTITTTGDLASAREGAGPPSGKETFTAEIDAALLRGDIDLAVHSAKDMPTPLPEGLAIGAVLEREDPRDALVLPAGAGIPADARTALAALGTRTAIGTGSVRRLAQLRPLAPDASFAPVRGNVDTRLRKLDAGEYSALVLACAGLRRLGQAARISVAIPVDACVPAPGQGIVAITARDDDTGTRDELRAIHDMHAGRALDAERAIVTALGGGCHLPLGALAVHDRGSFELLAAVGSVDGSRLVRASAQGGDPAALAAGVVDALLDQGAAELLGDR